MPANNLVKFLSLESLDHLNVMTSNRSPIESVIVTCFFEVTILEPLLNEIDKTQNRRFQTQIYEQRQPLFSKPLDANGEINLRARCSPNLTFGAVASSKGYQTFRGSLSFDGTNLRGIGQERLPAVSLEFGFLGRNYAVNDAASDLPPKVVFLDGDFLGFSFMSEDFSFVEGSSTREESYFIYDLERGSGAGDIHYYFLVPEIPAAASYFN